MPKATPSSTKLRGGFYTPREVTTFLSDWAITPSTTTVLEPSAGDGAFVDGLATRMGRLGRRLDELHVTACELDEDESAKVRARLDSTGLSGRVINGDFFESVRDNLAGHRFDAVVGNPPFLRFQYFPEASRERAFGLIRALGMRPNRLTNAWVPFVAVATDLCAPGGRLAMVIPAELLQVTYSAQLRQFLAERFGQITLVTFRTLVFGGVEQEVVLLLGDKSADGGIRVLELDGLEDLTDPYVLRRASAGLPLDHSEDKWTQYFLSDREFAAARAVLRSGERRLGDLASVDVGVVTGHNDFFLISAAEADSLAQPGACVPIVHRSAQLRGLGTTADDWASVNGGKYLLSLSDDDEPSIELSRYLDDGVRRGVPLGYKCRIRRNWWAVPSPYRPDAFMLRQIHLAPRVSLNQAAATSTDTVHRVRFRPGVDKEEAVLSFHGSVTFALAELLGRSYGGGVLELEPSEAERLPVGRLRKRPAWAASDHLLREANLSAVALETDRHLDPPAGLGPDDVRVLHGAWERLRDRRMKRGQSSRQSSVLAETA